MIVVMIVVVVVMMVVMVVVVMVVVVLLGECRERREAKCGAECYGDNLFHHGGFLQWLPLPRRTLAAVRMNLA
jgi:hypothetical protein